MRTNKLVYRISKFLYYKCSNYLTGDNREIYLYNANGDSFDEDFGDENNSNQFFNFIN